ncbi:lysine exporter protein [Thiohalobacter thiocyanaticus]|uniref:Lysine exporter protein n=1 Tax=Thiohalobacter thiocyanaticus TaxID=585455 RepID=A0A1Z4VNA8_9GAMM|nr:LysE family transporter [Thiohalobacter thiocyanaticus]BAZ92838.1 lysine exporter protein [Thiohalobacter thiocyanaticus]
MEVSISASDLAALFAAMAILAAVPSVSVAAVSARAASAGFTQGAITAMGVVAGDLVFILLALFGLALLVEALGEMFFLIRYLAAGYLLWLGLSLWRSTTRARVTDAAGDGSSWSSFMTGLMITLGDQKAVLFYLGFLPAFIQMDSLTSVDVAAVALTAVLAVGGVKLGYAFVAGRVGRRLDQRAGRLLNRVAAGVMVVVAIVMFISAS